MRVIVVGGVDLPHHIEHALVAAGFDVCAIDSDSDRRHDPEGFGARRLFGDPIDPATLEAAGAWSADVIVAYTRSDEDNLVISLLAKRRFEVPRVIARVNDLDNNWLFDATWGVDAAVVPSASLVELITAPRVDPAGDPS